MKNATFRQLRVFTEVARHLSFARAAEVLHLTQPAITAQIKALEEELGVALFDRRPGRISLTKAGDLVRKGVAQVLAEGKVKTPDLGGKDSTRTVGEAVRAAIASL